MKRRLAAALLIASCQPHVASPPRQCSPRPADFQRWADDIDDARWIVPPQRNTIALTRAGMVWNGVPLDGLIDMTPEQVLDLYLGQVAQLRPQPITAFDFEQGISCRKVERVRALMRRHLDCNRSRRCFQGHAPAVVAQAG